MGLADVFEKNEKKTKTMSVHRLLLIRLPRECLGYVTEMTERHRTGCCNVQQPEELGTLTPEP